MKQRLQAFGARFEGRCKAWLIAGPAALIALSASFGWAQVREAPRQAPFEVTLQPDRAQMAALSQAQASPLAQRLRGVLAQQTNIAPAIEAADTPVLAPGDVSLLRSAQFHPGDRQYTLVVERPGQIIEIYGAVRALQAPPDSAVLLAPARRTAPPAAALARRAAPLDLALRQAAAQGLEDVRVERTEYGVDVSFNRFGAAYSVTFICDDPESESCSEAEAVRFAATLELVGGGRR